jgi:hypothetical protein
MTTFHLVLNIPTWITQGHLALGVGTIAHNTTPGSFGKSHNSLMFNALRPNDHLAKLLQ